MTEHQTKIPKRRFKGFTGEWEREYLKDLGIFFKGSGISKTDLSDEGYSCVLYGELYTKYNEVIKDVQSKTNIELNNPVIGKVNDILIPSSGETAIDIATASCLQVDGVLLGGDLNIFRPHNVNGIFLSYQLGSSKKMEIAKMAQGASVVHVYNEQLKDLVVDIPSLQEQQKIGEFFSELDERIELQKSKIEKMKALKKAYLSEMFPAEGETTPKRRFKGFTGDWEEKKLGDLGSVAMNKRIFKNQTSDIGEIPFYKIGTFGGQPDAFISYELFKEYKKMYPYPKIGDLLISASGSIGRIVEYTGEDAYFQDSNIVWLKHDNKIDNSFLKQYYHIVKWQGLEGSTIKRLYNKNILQTTIILPSPQEQKKIGQFFSELDEMIELHEEKLKKLQHLKQAYLNELLI